MMRERARRNDGKCSGDGIFLEGRHVMGKMEWSQIG